MTWDYGTWCLPSVDWPDTSEADVVENNFAISSLNTGLPASMSSTAVDIPGATAHHLQSDVLVIPVLHVWDGLGQGFNSL